MEARPRSSLARLPLNARIITTSCSRRSLSLFRRAHLPSVRRLPSGPSVFTSERHCAIFRAALGEREEVSLTLASDGTEAPGGLGRDYVTVARREIRARAISRTQTATSRRFN